MPLLLPQPMMIAASICDWLPEKSPYQTFRNAAAGLVLQSWSACSANRPTAACATAFRRSSTMNVDSE